MMTLLLLGVALAAPPRSGAPTVACEGDPLQVSREAFELLVVDGSPEVLARLARCFEALDLPAAAQRHWLEALRAGPDEDLYREILGEIHALGEEVGDLSSVSWTIHDMREQYLPWGGPGVDAALYNHARDLSIRDRWRMAAEVLGDLEPDFRWYAWSRLHLGRAWEGAGEPALAAAAYEEAILAAQDDTAVRDLAVLSAAGLFARQGATEGAERLLSRVPRGSPLYGLASLTAARTRLQDQLDARTYLKRARKAVRGGALLPELGALELESDLRSCRVRRADRRYERWRAEMEDLRLVTLGVAGDDRPNGLLLYEQHLGPDSVEVGLPAGLAVRLAANESWLDVQAHLQAIDLELARLHTIDDPDWAPLVGQYVEDVLLQGQLALRTTAGRVFGAEVRRLGAEIESALEAAEELRGAGGCPKKG